MKDVSDDLFNFFLWIFLLTVEMYQFGKYVTMLLYESYYEALEIQHGIKVHS